MERGKKKLRGKVSGEKGKGEGKLTGDEEAAADCGCFRFCSILFCVSRTPC